MKKSFKESVQKSDKELTKEIQVIQDEIIKLRMDKMANPQKDTNIISKKKKQFAMLKTALQQKKLMSELPTVTK